MGNVELTVETNTIEVEVEPNVVEIEINPVEVDVSLARVGPQGAPGGGGAASISVDSDGVDVTNSLSSIDFTGDGVTVTNVGSAVTVDIEAGGSDTSQLPDGTAAEPAIRFASDQNTGIFRVDDDDLGFSAGGANRFEIRPTALVSTVPMVLPDGSSSAPSLRFTSDGDTGLYQHTSDGFAASLGGNVHTVWRTDELEVRQDLMLTSGNDLVMDTTRFTATGGTSIASQNYVDFEFVRNGTFSDIGTQSTFTVTAADPTDTDGVRIGTLGQYRQLTFHTNIFSGSDFSGQYLRIIDGTDIDNDPTSYYRVAFSSYEASDDKTHLYLESTPVDGVAAAVLANANTGDTLHIQHDTDAGGIVHAGYGLDFDTDGNLEVDTDVIATVDDIDNVLSQEIFWRDGNAHQHIVSLDSDSELVDIHVADSEYTPTINDVNYVPTGGAIGFHLTVPGETAQSLPFSGGVTLIINTDTHDFELAVPATLPSGVFDALNESTTFVFGLSDVTILRGDTPTETQIYTTQNGRLRSIHNKTNVAELATKDYVDNNAASKLSVSETAPTDPATGDQWFDCNSDAMRMYFYDGTYWVATTPAAGTDSVTDFLFEAQSSGVPVLADFTGNTRIIYQY